MGFRKSGHGQAVDYWLPADPPGYRLGVDGTWSEVAPGPSIPSVAYVNSIGWPTAEVAVTLGSARASKVELQVYRPREVMERLAIGIRPPT